MSSGVTRPSTLGGTISVANSAALAAMDVTGLPVGTVAWNIDVGAFFKLTASDRTEITIGDTDGYDSPQWTFADAVFTGFEDCTLLVSLAPPNEAFGGTYTIDTVDDPTIVTVTPAPDGATTAPIVGGVTLFDDALATDSVVAVSGAIGVRWVVVGAGTGTVESVTGDAVDDTDPANPVITAPNGWTVVTVAGSHKQDIDIPTTGNTDTCLEVFAVAQNNNGSNSLYTLQPNNLATGQIYQDVEALGTTGEGGATNATAFTDTVMYIGIAQATDGYAAMQFRFYMKAGTFRVLFGQFAALTSVPAYFGAGASALNAIWTDTSTAITNVRLHSNRTDGWKIGSRIFYRFIKEVP